MALNHYKNLNTWNAILSNNINPHKDGTKITTIICQTQDKGIIRIEQYF